MKVLLFLVGIVLLIASEIARLGALRSAYLQGRIDRSEELLRAVNSARNDAEIESAATAARSVA